MELSARLNNNWGWLVGFGVVLIALGMLAIGASAFTTLLSIVFLGALLVVGGVAMVINAFKSWRGHAGNFSFWLIFGLLYLAIGIILIKHPVYAAVSLTLLLAIFYMVAGAIRIFSAAFMHLPRSGWSIFSGIVAVVVGILILLQWPISGLFIIGLFIGIDLILNGWSYLMLGLAGRPR